MLNVVQPHKTTHIDQLKRTESPKTVPYICGQSYKYGQLISHKHTRTIQWRKMSLFNKFCWDNWTYTYKMMNLGPFFVSYIHKS